eukprot:6133552-Alexandrium_andersonii.AAC.1
MRRLNGLSARRPATRRTFSTATKQRIGNDLEKVVSLLTEGKDPGREPVESLLRCLELLS